MWERYIHIQQLFNDERVTNPVRVDTAGSTEGWSETCCSTGQRWEGGRARWTTREQVHLWNTVRHSDSTF